MCVSASENAVKQTLNDLRAFLSAEVSAIQVSGEKPDFEVVDLGYIEPGHGMKGRKQWLNTDSDVQMMYEQENAAFCCGLTLMLSILVQRIHVKGRIGIEFSRAQEKPV